MSEPYNMDNISDNIDSDGNIYLYYYEDNSPAYNKVTINNNYFSAHKTRYYYKDINDEY
jgi:hypothetical protein